MYCTSYHLDKSECGCSVFFNKKLTLKMLSIHTILNQCELFFGKHQNFDGISKFYDMEFLENFDFFVFVEFKHPSQRKRKSFVAECNLYKFFDLFNNTFDISKMLFVSIRMDYVEFEAWVTRKTYGREDFELIADKKHWNYVIRKLKAMQEENKK